MRTKCYDDTCSRDAVAYGRCSRHRPKVVTSAEIDAELDRILLEEAPTNTSWFRPDAKYWLAGWLGGWAFMGLLYYLLH